ncbi:MAG: hypothetical protein LT106_16715 [Burkholderiaceae bacterium]|nr:hypothetical protein [Burkholderiaceae bacterium]
MNEARPVFVEFVAPVEQPVPPDVEATFAECVRVGLYSEADREGLRAGYRVAPEAMRRLVADMAERIDRCSRCRYLRGVGASARCLGRDVNRLPADRGAHCSAFAPAVPQR